LSECLPVSGGIGPGAPTSISTAASSSTRTTF
jgi:hypothetical protein